MARPRTKTIQVAIRVDERLLQCLQDDAAAHGRTVAQSVRHYVRQGLVGEGAAESHEWVEAGDWDGG